MSKSYKIYLNQKANSIDELFFLLANFAQQENVVKDKKDFIQALNEREKIDSTGLENGISIPHGISEKILKHFIFIVRLQKEIEWKTFDNSNVTTIICFAVPKKTEGNHLKVLQQVSVMLLNKKNQEVLKNGKLEAIANLFDSIKIESSINIDIKPATEPKFSSIKKNDEVENLMELKHSLMEKYQKTKNVKLQLEIKKIEQEIIACRRNIVQLKTKLKIDKTKINNDYKKDLKKINLDLEKQKLKTKKNLEKFKLISNKEKSKIPKDTSKETINKFNYQLYLKKNKILEPLNSLKFKKQDVIGNYRKEKTQLKENAIEQIKFNNFKIINPKNIFHIHGNKIQLVMMIILAVIGMWSIVLGSIGVGTFKDFIASDISKWNSLNIEGFDQMALDNWAMTIISSNVNISISAIFFGVLAITLCIPMKLFKLQGVIYEKQAIVSSIFSFCVIVIAFILVLLSIDNIESFKANSNDAVILNKHFQNALILNEPLKTLTDFKGNQADYDLYLEEMKIIFKEYKFEVVNDENRILALAEAKIEAAKEFKTIVLDQKLISWFVNLNDMKG